MFKISINEKHYSDAVSKQEKEPSEKKQKTQSRAELDKKLRELEAKAAEEYEKGESGNYSFKFAKTDDTSDEQIGEKAAREAEEKYLKLADEKKTESEAKKDELEKHVFETEQKRVSDNAATARAYDDAKSAAESDALKRGMGRSSTIVELLKEYDKEKLSKIEKRNAAASAEIEDINSQIANLGAQLEQSLKKLDMQKAIEINDRIEELKAEREQKNSEALKYNNEVREKIAKYNEQLMSAAAARGEKNYLQRAKAYKDQMAYAVIDYYSGLSKEDALLDFASSDFASRLDDEGLALVRNYLKSRG